MSLIRSFAAFVVAVVALASAAAGQEPVKIRFTLDWKLQGIHA